jgi:Acyclic terpene utilisation family protein AtuA
MPNPQPKQPVMETRLLANCVVGLGFSRNGFDAALQREPHMIGCDAGTADGGPGYLGSGRDSKSQIAVRRDLDLMIRGARRLAVPLVIGSCGGAGARPQVTAYLETVTRIARELAWHPVVARIDAEQHPAALHRAVADGAVSPLGHQRTLTHDDIDASVRIVGMMGAGPIATAIDAGADIVLAGRCADPAIYAATALLRGHDPAIAWHAGKSIDKGYLATTTPEEGSPVLARLAEGRFTVEPTKLGTVCTTTSIAAMTMYENSDPFQIAQPSGVLDLASAAYHQVDRRTVEVTGSRWRPASTPSVKLEGAKLTGYRAILIAGIRDHRVIERLDTFLHEVKTLLERGVASLGVPRSDWSVQFRCYGRDAVLGPAEFQTDYQPHEIGLVIDVVARTQELAVAVAGRSGPIGSRYNFTGKLGGGGNYAYPFSPSTIAAGPVYEWSAWHVMEVADESAPFATEVIRL